jgi:hypothetical protein
MCKSIEERFLKTKDLAFALEEINAMDNLNMLLALSAFKATKLEPEIIEDLLYLFNWRAHQRFTKNLTIYCLKHIDSIDFEKTLLNLVLTKEGKEFVAESRNENKDIDTR